MSDLSFIYKVWEGIAESLPLSLHLRWETVGIDKRIVPASNIRVTLQYCYPVDGDMVRPCSECRGACITDVTSFRRLEVNRMMTSKDHYHEYGGYMSIWARCECR
jgi:hypothetical protein